MVKIFISYARRHKATTILLECYLKEKGFSVDWDDHLIPSDDWRDDLGKRIGGCDIFLYLLTAQSIESVYCLHEYNMAIEEKKHIVPVFADTLAPHLCPDSIRAHAIELTQEDGLSKLEETLKNLDLNTQPTLNKKIDPFFHPSVDETIKKISEPLREIYLLAFGSVLFHETDLTSSLRDTLKVALQEKFNIVFIETELQVAVLAYVLGKNENTRNIIVSLNARRRYLSDQITAFKKVWDEDQQKKEPIREAAEDALNGILDCLSQLVW